MMHRYTFPVVHYYGEDDDDYTVTQCSARIYPVKLSSEPYEAELNAMGKSFHLIFGSQTNGNFLCVPNWHMGCELSSLDDVSWNLNSILTDREYPMDFELSTAIAYALRELGGMINQN